jgi:curved DNA-binding protein CbpA
VNSIYRLIATSATRNATTKTYYEILGLQNNCSQKEIRIAFLLLSKQHHPDVKPAEKTNNEDFVRVLEAYQVLSKTHSRANYDMSLKGIDRVNFVREDTVHEPWQVDPLRYTSRDKYNPYYGIRGLNRMPHWKIVMACVIFCLIGVCIQALAISKSVTFKREQLTRSSSLYSESHHQVRAEAVSHGKEEQLERVKSRLKKSMFDE